MAAVPRGNTWGGARPGEGAEGRVPGSLRSAVSIGTLASPGQPEYGGVPGCHWKGSARALNELTITDLFGETQQGRLSRHGGAGTAA